MENCETVKRESHRATEQDVHSKPLNILRIYVDRAQQCWVVLDSQGDFWELPFGKTSWEMRRRIELNDDLDLEPIPVHYKYQLGLPA